MKFKQSYYQPYRSSRKRRFSGVTQKIRPWGKRAIVALFLSLALLWGLPASVPLAWGQTPEDTAPAEPRPPAAIEPNIPGGLSNLLSSVGNSRIVREAVYLDGRRLFTLASPVIDTTVEAEMGQAPPTRSEIYESRLQALLDRGFVPQTLQVESDFDESDRQPVVYASFEAEDGTVYTDRELLRVTLLDADINGTELETWADEIATTLQQSLIQAHQERQPDNIQRQAIFALGILLLTGILSWSLACLQRRLQQEQQRLCDQSQHHSQQISSAPDLNDSPSVTTALLERRVETQQQQGLNDIKRRLAQVLQVGLWSGSLLLVLGLFPQTRQLYPFLYGWLRIPLQLLVIGGMTYFAIRVSGVLLDRFFLALQHGTHLSPSPPQRLMLRFNTFSRVTKSLVALVCMGAGLIAAITTIGLQISPALLTGAGIIGVGISLASQNLIKDFINGFLILLEDQYGVGDVIVVGEVAGFVENMNLRITQLRNEEGRLITIPNSEITVVQNLSKEWSRVDLSVSVAYSADLNRALQVIEQVAKDISHDRLWRDLILEPPLLLGVERLDHVGATVRLWIKTQPLKQWDVAREYRRRLKLAFDAAGILIGVPQQFLSIHQDQNQSFNLLHHSQSLQQKGAPQDGHPSSSVHRS